MGKKMKDENYYLLSNMATIMEMSRLMNILHIYHLSIPHRKMIDKAYSLIRWVHQNLYTQHLMGRDAIGEYASPDARLTSTLIDAAPALLDALKTIVSSLSEHDGNGLIEHVEPMRKARAAIDLAEGWSRNDL